LIYERLSFTMNEIKKLQADCVDLIVRTFSRDWNLQ